MRIPVPNTRVVAVAAVLVAYVAARPASSGSAAARNVAIRFSESTIPDPDGPLRTVRRVHPSLAHISSWISAVGAGIALADLDGDGLPNDACHVDPRADAVHVRPAPGSPARFDPVRLVPPPLASEHATAPMGCVVGDVNEDGRLDPVVYFWGRTPVAFLAAHAPLAPPAYVALDLVPGAPRWYSNAAVFADLDGDGHADLVVGNYFPDGARILDDGAGGREEMQASMSRASNGGTKRLLRWAGLLPGSPARPRFDDVSSALDPGVARGWSLAVGAADLDGDARPELYFSNDFGPDHLLHNRSDDVRLRFAALTGERTLTTPASKVLGRDSFKGMGVDFGDVNGDGRLDLYVSNIASTFALEESHFVFVSTGDAGKMHAGIAPYVDRSEPLGLARSGWGWDARLADFDNDGTLEAVQATGFLRGSVDRWPELHELAMSNDALLANPRHWPRFQPGDDVSGHDPNPFFVLRGGRYHDVSSIVGTGRPQVTRGLAIADVDGDGLLDLAAANQWEPSRFYTNVTRGSGAFLGLHLLASRAGHEELRHVPGHPRGAAISPAFGAAVEIHTDDGRRFVAQADGGSGHSGKRSADVHVGLGDLPPGRAVTTTITWRAARGVRRATLALAPGWHSVWLNMN